jgi:hypothetical protein
MLKKIAYFGSVAIVTLLVGGPWAIYWLGLHGIAGKPEPPVSLASRERQLAVWQLARGTAEPESTPLNPYSYLLTAAEPGASKPALLVAWWVASEYNLSHQRYAGMGWWHLSGAALTLWLTRNWSIEQLLTKAAEGRVKSAA